MVISLQNQADDENVPMETDGASIENLQEELGPLQIGSVLEKVFSNLDVDSIKNARQVNPLWSIEGAKMLMTKCYLKIPSDLQLEPSNNKLMDEFKAFLSHKSSDRSMIPNITIEKKSDVELWKPLGVLGQQVESLKMNIIEYKTAQKLQNLLDLLPNLKYLNITHPSSIWTTSELNVLTSVVSATEKHQGPLVISNFTLMVQNMEELENIEKFADCNNILIEELDCFVDPSRFGDVPNLGIRISNFISKLLSRSQNILKSLGLVNCLSFLHNLNFPCMPALTILEFESLSEPDDPLQPIKFSPTFRFSEKVPNLIDVKLTLSHPHFFAHLFEQTGTAPSVKMLEYNYEFDDYDIDIDPLLLTFPNIEEYKTSCLTNSQTMFESLWTYGANLKKLTIEIQNFTYNPADIDGLDSLITGFTQETVDKIKKTPNLAPYPLEEMEQLRVNPSILNLKRLEHFIIDFWNIDQHDVPGRFLLTAGEYAFKLMPKECEIILIFPEVGREGPWSPLLDEVSKLPNVTVKFDEDD